MDKSATRPKFTKRKVPQAIKKSFQAVVPLNAIDAFLVELSDITRFGFRYFKELIKPPYEFMELIRQCFVIGYKTLGLVTITGFIMGVVLTIQSKPTLAKFGAESWLPGMISVSVIREVGPVITALIFAGKVGSGIGAELASMNVTEQIDAMEVSGINPFKYIVVTRVLAATLMLPLLVIFSDTIALFGSYIAINLQGHLRLDLFYAMAFQKIDFIDIFPAFIKTFFFGFAIGLISCFKGYYSHKGTEGVGIAANTAVVAGSLMVFIIDVLAVQVFKLIYKLILVMEEATVDTIGLKAGADKGKGEIVLNVEHVSKAFGQKEILLDISLGSKKGENLIILGKSGTGKSVLIKCIVRLIDPDKGKITVFGKNMATLENDELNAIRKKIGFLFQGAALYDSMTVRENLEFPLRQSHKKRKEEITASVVEVLENVGLADAIDKMPSELSGGMQKRIGLARTLILRPEIMLYDEPTTGLDPVTSKEISHLILDVQKKYNTSSIIITHDMDCARITANRVIVLFEGKVRAEGTLKELEKSEDKFVRSFFE